MQIRFERSVGKSYATVANAETAINKFLLSNFGTMSEMGRFTVFITVNAAGRYAPVVHVTGSATQYVHCIAAAGFYVFN